MLPVSELLDRSNDCKLVQFEMYGEMGPLRSRFWREILYTRPLLQVTPARLKLKSEHGFLKVELFQLLRLLCGSDKDSNKRVRQDSSFGSGEDGGRKAQVSMRRSGIRMVRMLGSDG